MKEIKEEDKNHDFVQMYRDNLETLSFLSTNKSALNLFILLLKHMDGMNALTVSINALTEIMGVSRATVLRSVKFLKEHGYVAVLKTGNSNVYVVNPDIAWTSYGYQKKYCKFPSNVLLSSSENAEYLKNPEASYRFKTIDDAFIKSVQEKHKEFEAKNQIFDEETGEIFD